MGNSFFFEGTKVSREASAYSAVADEQPVPDETIRSDDLLAWKTRDHGRRFGLVPCLRVIVLMGCLQSVASECSASALISEHETVRKLVIGTGVVTTLAGSSGLASTVDGIRENARFVVPAQLDVSRTGTFALIPDYNQHVIRSLVISTGAVTTLAGSVAVYGTLDGSLNTARLRLPYAISISPDGTWAVFSDLLNHMIRKVEISTGIVTKVAGWPGTSGYADGTGSTVLFNCPAGISLTPDGTAAIVSDQANHVLRRVVISSGVVSTLAGLAGNFGYTDGTGSVARFKNPMGLAVSYDGSFAVFTEINQPQIRSIDLTSLAVKTIVANSTSLQLNGLAISQDASYAIITGMNLIFKVTLPDGVITTVAGGASGHQDGNGTNAGFNAAWGVGLIPLFCNCSAGMFTNVPASNCTRCQAGKYSNVTGRSACSSCWIGSFASGQGLTSCGQCGAGTYTNVTGRSACSGCRTGTFASGQGLSSCGQCGPGTYSNVTGVTACSPCPPGSYQPATSSTSCIPCPPGTHQPSSNGSAACLPCGRGAYQPAAGATACAPCPAGQSNFLPGATECAGCAYTQGLERLVRGQGPAYRTGGLGRDMTAEYDTWWCLRQACVPAGDWACYRYHVTLQALHFWGTNSDLGLV